MTLHAQTAQAPTATSTDIVDPATEEPRRRRFRAPANEREALATMRGLIFGFYITQSIAAVAELGIADLLSAGPRTAAELAADAAVHERPLYRILRALAGEGVLREDEQGRFVLTPMAELLRSDHPRSLRDCAIYGSDLTYKGAPGLLTSLKTGEPAFPVLFGMPLFDYLAAHPEYAAKLGRAMSSISATRTAGLLQAYDFSGTKWLLDVGGAHGATTAAIAERYPSIRCMCIDRPGAEQGALKMFAEHGVSARCTFLAADFFRDYFSAGPDTYLLAAVLHDWDDQHCLELLRNCRRGMAGTARLLVVDIVLAPEKNVHDTYRNCLDLAVMTQVGGRERTETEFRALLASAGFDLLRVVGMDAPQSLLVAQPS
jgi:predicted O-methyltransferase YrrM